MMSRALDNRLPPPKSGLEFTPENTFHSQNLKMMNRALDNKLPPPGLEYESGDMFQDEDWEGDDKGDLNFL